MSDGFKKVPTIFNAEPGKTKLDIPKKKRQPFKSSLGKSAKVLSDTVKQGSEIAKKSLSGSSARLKKVSSSAPKINISKRTKKASKKIISEDTLESKVEKLFSSQDLLFERLESEPKLSDAMRKSLASIKLNAKKSSGKLAKSAKTASSYMARQPLPVKIALVVVIAFSAGSISLVARTGDKSSNVATGQPNVSSEDINQVAGAATANEGIKTTDPSFKILTPGGDKLDNGVERNTPSGDKVYSFDDTINNTRVEVTQQQLPEALKTDTSNKLADFAKVNYLSSVIQINQDKIYYGINDKNGVQSLVTTREGLLIFIKADNKIPDEYLISYILSLE